MSSVMARMKFKNRLYFGYDQKGEDVKAYYEKNEVQSTFDKYNKAQAYIDDIFHNYHDDYKNLDKKRVIEGLNLMNEIKDETSMYTLTGSLKNKFANDVSGVVLYNQIMDLGFDKQELKKFFKKGLYPEQVVNHSKLLLENCPKNAILLSKGDNNLFPLFYLQEVEKYRTDVLVVDQSILSYPEYIEYVAEKGVQFNGDLAFYRSDLAEMFVINPTRIEDTNFFNVLNKQDAPIENLGGMKYVVFPSSLKLANKWILIKGKYLNRMMVAGLDILFSNQRPVCTVLGEYLNIERKNFTEVGLVNVVTDLFDPIELEKLKQLNDSLYTSSLAAKIDLKNDRLSFISRTGAAYYFRLLSKIENQNDITSDPLFQFYLSQYNTEGVPSDFLIALLVKCKKEGISSKLLDQSAERVIQYWENKTNSILVKEHSAINYFDFKQLERALFAYNLLTKIDLMPESQKKELDREVTDLLNSLVENRPYLQLIYTELKEIRTLFLNRNKQYFFFDG